mgnify:CR=1 FL=1
MIVHYFGKAEINAHRKESRLMLGCMRQKA